MPDVTWDVVIVGGGPAGSSTALRLARAGFSVALVDRARFPRSKPCGEFMSPECLPHLRELDVFDEVERLGARRVSSMELHAHGRQAAGRFVPIGRARPPQPYGWAVRRDRLDHVLLRAAARAGAVVHESTRFDRLQRAPDGAVTGIVVRDSAGETRALRARWTIAADGVRSRVARELGVRREIPWLRKLAFTTHFAGVPWGDGAQVHFGARDYWVCAPVDGGLLSVNWVLDQCAVNDAHARPDEQFARGLASMPELEAELACGRRVERIRGVGPLAFRTTRKVFGGAALVGDAAGYVDPLTGEGIFFALLGGRLLGESLARALHAGRVDHAALADYESAHAREIGARCRASLLVQRALRHPSFAKVAIRLLERRSSVADWLVSVAGDYAPLCEALRPRVLWNAATGAHVSRGGD
ncbi:MAG: NAD(P)/FAD-dependent oxidoreductase [Planctomycetota bacterium]